STYISFLQRNSEWAQIIRTPVCSQFRNNLANKVIPRTVQPLIDLSEDTSIIIQMEAFRIMRERHHDTIADKKIRTPADIEIKIGRNEINDNYFFTNEIVNKAAKAVNPFWKVGIERIESLSADDKKSHKVSIAEMIKATQEMKAFSYAFVAAY